MFARRLSFIGFLAALLIPGAAYAELYKQIDENGNVTYTDKPGKGTPVKSPGLTTYSPPALHTTPPAPNTKAGSEGEDETKAVTAYSQLVVATPTQEQTVQNNEGRIEIKLALKPALNTKAGHKIAILVDRKKAAESLTLEASVANIDRGSHVVSAQVVDASGKVLKQSGDVTFHLQRHFIPRKSK